MKDISCHGTKHLWQIFLFQKANCMDSNDNTQTVASNICVKFDVHIKLVC